MQLKLVTSRIGLFAVCFLFVMFSCKRKGCVDPDAQNYEPRAKRNDGSCISYGYVHFLVDSPCSYLYVKDTMFDYQKWIIVDSTLIVMDGDTTKLFNYFYGVTPECNKRAAAVIKKYPGVYKYIATDYCNSWEGEVEVTSEGCEAVLLHR